jgi:adenylate cyclase
MSADDVKRKLAAIFSADVKGYSRLMQDDEEATVRTINVYRDVMIGLIKDHSGRVVDAKGDNVLAEFSSVVDAVRCAVRVQEELKERNVELPEKRRMEFRIGINLGDVIEDGTIYGDGVNIAARLEGLAEAGGICISGTAFDQVEGKLGLEFESLGEKAVKNIEKPVRVYKVLTGPEAAEKGIGEKKPGAAKKRWAVMTAIVVLAVASGLIWNLYVRPDVEPASVERMAFPLPEKPSIAVLPFANMSGDSEQEYIADGMTENIISALSQISEMFVIARNSTFAYKGRPIKVQKVAEDLGVRYVLEGSVQRSGDRIRVTAQLIDATQGHHLWSERYDRRMQDLFALQDEITKEIVVALQVKLTLGEQGRVWHHYTDNLEAWSRFVKAYTLFERFTKADNQKARELFQEVVKLEPEHASAWTLISWTHWIDARFGFSKTPSESFKKSVELAKKALAMDREHPNIHSLWGGIHLFQRQYDKAIEAGERAIELGPSNSEIHSLLAMSVHYAGDFKRAINLVKKAMRLSPIYPNWYLNQIGEAYYMAGDYEKAVETYRHMKERAAKLNLRPFYANLGLTASYMSMGREKEAQYHAEQVLKDRPRLTLESLKSFFIYKNRDHQERILSALRKAGLPDRPPMALPDKPSIAVLPFVNMSGDTEQDYFSDGLTEEIITGLAKVPDLFVIARNSTFTYKGKPVKVQQVARELGVRYILEGSVRMAGGRVRITAQLIEAETGKHLWAERYDRDLKDIFALQDEITGKVITALRVKLTEGEQARLTGKGTQNLEAYLKVLQARRQFFRMNKQGSMESRRLAKKAIALDPEFAVPYTILALTHMMDLWFKFSESPKESMRLAVEAAQKALALDDTDPATHIGLCMLYIMQRKHDKAIAAAKRTMELSPSGANAYSALGTALRFACRPNEAIPMVRKAISLNPISNSILLRGLGVSLQMAGRYEEAILSLKKSLKQRPDDLFAHLYLAVCFIASGREEDARAEAKEVMRIHPEFSLNHFAKTLPYKDQSVVDNTIARLRKAGLK